MVIDAEYLLEQLHLLRFLRRTTGCSTDGIGTKNETIFCREQREAMAVITAWLVIFTEPRSTSANEPMAGIQKGFIIVFEFWWMIVQFYSFLDVLSLIEDNWLINSLGQTMTKSDGRTP